jgi:hypothetical protein
MPMKSGTKTPSKPVFVYSDDTGQQTTGRHFVFCGIAITQYRRLIEEQLKAIEEKSEKRLDDWASCNPKRLRNYLELAIGLEGLHGTVFYRRRENIGAGAYEAHAIDAAIAVAVAHEPTSNRTFIPEGMPAGARTRLKVKARSFPGGSVEVWSGGFDKTPIVRLADSLAGLVAQPVVNPGGRKDFPDLIQDWFKLF